MTDDEKATLADVYEKAAEYLEEYGWKRSFGMHGYDRCIMGAFESVTWDSADDRRWSIACTWAMDVLELVGREEDYGKHPLSVWNDDPSRTKDEVINLCLGLANKLR